MGCLAEVSDRNNMTSWSGYTFVASVVPSAKLPVDLFVLAFFRFKEYSDNTTTMDQLLTLAGGAIAIGNFDYFGLSPEELYEQVPVTRDYEQTRSDEALNLGIGIKVRFFIYF